MRPLSRGVPTTVSPRRCALTITLPDSSKVRIAYIDEPPSVHKVNNQIIVLLHGFPQTSFQFRDVLPLLATEGYRCIAPDYRGAGGSSKDLSPGDFRKSTMAGDIVALLDALHITEPVHVVGHDIGGMIAFALASRWPERVRSLSWGECPLPGTQSFERDTTDPEVRIETPPPLSTYFISQPRLENSWGISTMPYHVIRLRRFPLQR